MVLGVKMELNEIFCLKCQSIDLKANIAGGNQSNSHKQENYRGGELNST